MALVGVAVAVEGVATGVLEPVGTAVCTVVGDLVGVRVGVAVGVGTSFGIDLVGLGVTVGVGDGVGVPSDPVDAWSLLFFFFFISIWISSGRSPINSGPIMFPIDPSALPSPPSSPPAACAPGVDCGGGEKPSTMRPLLLELPDGEVLGLPEGEAVVNPGWPENRPAGAVEPENEPVGAVCPEKLILVKLFVNKEPLSSRISGSAHDIRTTKPSEEAAKKQMNVSSVRASRKDPIRPESCFRDMEGRFI